ncbi:MAG: glycosyltransferase WbuB [Thermostichales cyanobacterium DRC_bins_46]
MRILIYGLNFAPEPTGIGKYSGEMAAWLAARGHQVRVVTTPPYYPAWQVDPQYCAWHYRRETWAGVQIWRCPLWVKKQPSGLERLLHLLSFALSSLPVMLRQILWHADVVIVIEPAFFCTPMALITARLGGSRAWLHIQDFEMDAAFELGIIPKKLKGFVANLEQWLTQSFDRISTISPGMLARLAEKGIPKSKQVLFPNWVDIHHIYPLNHPSPMRAELGIPDDSVVILYSGSMGKKQGLEVLLQVANQYRDQKGVIFILCGDGVARPDLETLADQLQLSNLMWLPLQPRERLNHLLNLADIHALIQKEASADLVMPSKLTGMLASGRPVVATALPETTIGQVMTAADCGCLVPPDQPDALYAALQQMIGDPERRRIWGVNARRYACEHLGQEQILSRWLESLEELVIVR